MKPVPIGIVGLNFGAQIVRQLQQAPANRHLRLVAVCDLDADKAARVSAASGVRAVPSFAALLVDPEIEAVGIFTGPRGRAALVRQSVRAGKHVLTTKPFELDPVAARQVLTEAQGLHRVVHLNSPAPVVPPDLAQIRRWQQRHSLGRLVGIRGEAWGSYDERADGSWYDDPALCPVAPIFRLGIYLIHDVIALAGQPVAAQAAQARVRTGRPTPDNASVTLHLPGGGLATLFASFCVGDGQPYRNALTVNFERGTVYRNVGPATAAPGVRAELVLVRPGRSGKPIVRRRSFRELSGDYQWANFAAAVRGKPVSALPPPDVILGGLGVIRALRRAASTGRTIPVA